MTSVIPPKASIAILALPISFSSSPVKRYIRICPLLSDFYSRIIIPRNFKKLSEDESFCTLDDETLHVKKSEEVVIKVNLSRKLRLICEDFQYFYMDGNCYLEKWMNYEEEKKEEKDPSILGPHIIFPNITEANEFRKQFGGGIFLTKASYLHNSRGEMFTFEWKKEHILYDFQKDKIYFSSEEKKENKKDLKIINPFKDSSVSSYLVYFYLILCLNFLYYLPIILL